MSEWVGMRLGILVNDYENNQLSNWFIGRTDWKIGWLKDGVSGQLSEWVVMRLAN